VLRGGRQGKIGNPERTEVMEDQKNKKEGDRMKVGNRKLRVSGGKVRCPMHSRHK
jgi:hypothetical protein